MVLIGINIVQHLAYVILYLSAPWRRERRFELDKEYGKCKEKDRESL